ncbi:MAG: hypothetical protein EA347_04790 [Thioalkalivibrio sp.]|nr:MAG: hypothetical protein EA347_04790 [Thioalkalivibrio sp.]
MMAAALALAVSSAAIAQMGQQPGAMEQEFMEIQQQLAQIQQQAVENNPGLRDQADALEELVTDKMREAGHDPGAIMEDLLAAQARMEEARTDAERREILESPEVLQAQQDLQEAQQAAMQDPEVQAAQQALEEDMMDAMRREDPQTDRLLERMQEIQEQAQPGMR